MFADRPVEVEAEGRELLIHVLDWRSAWQLCRYLSVFTIPFLQTLQQQRLKLRLRIGNHVSMQVLPRPHFVLRLLVPGLRSIRETVQRDYH